MDNVTYTVYDECNRRIEHFGGPCRLAKWGPLLPGWGIERFLGNVSQGCVTLDDVRAHAAEYEDIDNRYRDPQPNQMAY